MRYRMRVEEELRAARRGDDPTRELKARMRAGEVSREVLDVLAHAGHVASRAVMELGPHGPWTQGLMRWSRDLAHLLSRLEPVERTCSCLAGEQHLGKVTLLNAVQLECAHCSRTGVVQVRAENWWSVAVTLAAAQACMDRWSSEDPFGPARPPASRAFRARWTGSKTETAMALNEVRRWQERPGQRTLDVISASLFALVLPAWATGVLIVVTGSLLETPLVLDYAARELRDPRCPACVAGLHCYCEAESEARVVEHARRALLPLLEPCGTT